MIRKLHVLGNRANEEILPVKIYKIVGFGSFFRLKESPGDVDLLIKYSSINPIYDLFKQIMDNVVELYNEDPEKFLKPIDALVYYINVHRNSLPFLSEYVNVFSGWIENITWGMISRQYPQSLAYHYERLTKRVLQRNLRSIRIAMVMSFYKGFVSQINSKNNYDHSIGGNVKKDYDDDRLPLMAKKYYTIWTKDKPDIYYHLDKLFSSSEEIVNLP